MFVLCAELNYLEHPSQFSNSTLPTIHLILNLGQAQASESELADSANEKRPSRVLTFPLHTGAVQTGWSGETKPHPSAHNCKDPISSPSLLLS